MEVIVFTAILVMGFLALTSTSLTVHSLRRANDERRIAGIALDSMIQEIRQTADGLSGSDPAWGTNVVAACSPGGVLGDTFDVRGLQPQVDAQAVGTIQVVSDETLTDLELETHLGLPIDLDNDGAVDNIDVRGTAQILPIVVRVAWQGAAGPQEIRQELFVLSY